jgi:outer membrane protein TolC
MIKKSSLFIVFALILVFVTRAEKNTELKLDMNSLINSILKNNLTLKIERLKLKQSEISRKKDYNSLFPNVSLSYSKNKEKYDNGLVSKTELTSIKLFQNFPGFFKSTPIANEISALRLKKAYSNYKNAENGVLFKGITYYFQLKKAINEKKIYEKNLYLINELLKIAKINFKAGLSLKSDILRVEAQKSDITVSLLDAKNDIEKIIRDLNLIINNEKVINYEVGDNLKYKLETKNKEYFIKRALENSIELKNLENDIKIAEKMLKIAKNEYLPTVNVSLSKTDVKEGAIPDNDYSFSVSATLNIYDSGDVNLDIVSMRKGVEIAKLNYEQKKREKISEVEKAYLDYILAVSKIKAREKEIKSSEENMRLVKEKFKNGISGVVDVIDAQVLLTKTYLSAINAYYDERIKLAKLYYEINEIEKFRGICDEK